jgi:FemAB family
MCAFALIEARTRALYGHFIWCIERFGPAANEEARTAALHAVVEHAYEYRRLLGIRLEVFSPDAQVRGHTGQVARELGFFKREKTRMYTDTIAVNLRPSEAEIFASLHPTARRHIRATAKHQVEIGIIDDPAYARRMTELSQETLRRTQGHPERRDWASIIQFSRVNPTLSRIVGLYDQDLQRPESLLAFAWGRHHGDHGDYAVAASTRNTHFKMPLGYALAWDLMCWAKRNGAIWFDFGGITAGHFGTDDPLGGVSDFKRYFGGDVITVGEEWLLEPHPFKAKVANAVSAGAALMRRLAGRRAF